MYWNLYVWMLTHDRSDGYWSVAAVIYSLEHVGIIVRAMRLGGQVVKVLRHDGRQEFVE